MNMKTPWTDTVDRELPLPEYPRPQMVRDNWINLNGPWEYAITASPDFPERYDGQILVPFSPETELSGVSRLPGPEEYLWYRRQISLPESFHGKRVLLHFGAVDQCATVWVNGREAASHVGGYLPFELEVTDALEGDTLSITVRVTDDTEHSGHTRGKQSTHRGGIWYTPQSGIWQTVWLEAVPYTFIRTLRITPEYDEAAVSLEAEIDGEGDAFALFEGQRVRLPGRIEVPGFEAWSPEHPRLYSFEVVCGEDRVESYFAMRKFSVERDGKGVPRLFLNGSAYFHNGLLDQGYWPDGLYTAPSDEALIFDIRTAKACGFNMLRKHIKVEPLRWYYHCDRLGMLVWQDMPCGGGRYDPLIVSAPLFTGLHLSDGAYRFFGRQDRAVREEFRAELTDLVKHLYNCPCIALWVIFNEGWGQFDAGQMLSLVQALDKTRTIDHASGWHDQGIGDVRSEHVYFRKYRFHRDRRGRAVLLSEFGGYNHAVPGHVFGKHDFGYKRFETPEQLAAALTALYREQIAPAKRNGLAAAVYTQLSDVEDELNGLVTYDRRVVKIDPEKIKMIMKVEE